VGGYRLFTYQYAGATLFSTGRTTIEEIIMKLRQVLDGEISREEVSD
jgi:hypothetical protein